MNTHSRMEAKRARRRKRTTGATKGKVRGPVTRALGRMERERVGQERVFTMIDSTRTPTVTARMKTRADAAREAWLAERERFIDKFRRAA